MADWTSLPPELLTLVADNLSAVEDLAAFSSACRSFNSAAPKEHWPGHSALRRTPWLLLCSQDGDGENPPNSQRDLINMYKNNQKFFMDLPELQGRKCWGSSYCRMIPKSLGPALGGSTIFVGGCQSISLEAAEAGSCRSNCIYFCDDAATGHDMGIYDFKEKAIEQFYDGVDSFSSYSTPTWFIPAFT